MSYLQYKDHEEDLKKRFAVVNIEVRIEQIDSADIYYTDGDAANSKCKLIFAGGKPIYLPQIIYHVSDQERTIIKEWMESIFTDTRG